MRVLENAELKYTLEELLKKSAGAAHYSLCVVKYSVAIKRRSQNARGWILNLLEREPCLADGAAGSIGEGRVVFLASCEQRTLEALFDRLLTAARRERIFNSMTIGAFREADEGSGLDEMYKKALRAQLYAENTGGWQGHFYSEEYERNFMEHVKEFWEYQEEKADAEFILKIQEDSNLSYMIQEMKQYDKVTKLPDYDTFLKKSMEIIEKDREHRHFGVLYADILGFKALNSIYGEQEGNRMLLAFADHLRKSDFYLCGSRVYADNFVALFTIPEGVSAEDMAEKFHRETEAFLAREWEAHPKCFPGFVCGICEIPNRAKSIHPYISRAEQVRKSLKPTFVSRCAIFTEEMEKNHVRRRRLSEQIMQAFSDDGFYFVLQPLFDIRTGEITGAEALARMRSTGEEIMPGEFIPLMETVGDITRLDFLIYDKVCRYMAERKRRGLSSFSVSVNISREEFKNAGFVDDFHRLVTGYGVDPKDLGLEITESIFVENLMEISDAVNRFREYGYPILLDDFGSGFSSLNVLKDISFDIIKLDRSFLGRSEITYANKSIINSIVILSRDLNVEVLCEGVENEAQARFLKGIGCKMAQGFFYAKPMAVEDFEMLYDKIGSKRKQE